MSEKQTNKLIKKANELVESRYKFDIWETRVFAKMITLINKSDADFKTYRIYIKEIQDDFGLAKNKDAYTRLKEGARRLMRRILKVSYEDKEGTKVLETPVIIGLETVLDGKSYIDVSFHPNMKPFLLQLKSQFLMYDIRNILKISSVYSIRIYELLKQYEKIGSRTFLVEELKDILQVADKYPLYANFKQRIIKKSQKDLIKNTDISFTFEEIKNGRSVEKIKFLIHKNGQESTPIPDGLPEVNVERSKLEKELKKQGITDSTTIQKVVAKYEADYIIETLNKCATYFKKNKSVKNKVGYLLEALDKGYYRNEIAADQKKLETRKAKELKEQQFQSKKESLEKLKSNFQQNYAKKIEGLRIAYYSQELEEQVLESKKGTPLYMRVKQAIQKQQQSKILDAWVNDYLAKTYLNAIEYDLDLFLRQNGIPKKGK